MLPVWEGKVRGSVHSAFAPEDRTRRKVIQGTERRVVSGGMKNVVTAISVSEGCCIHQASSHRQVPDCSP